MRLTRCCQAEFCVGHDRQARAQRFFCEDDKLRRGAPRLFAIDENKASVVGLSSGFDGHWAAGSNRNLRTGNPH